MGTTTVTPAMGTDEPTTRRSSGDRPGSFPSSPGEVADWSLPLAPGDRVGPYGVVRLLGAGGMGAVYEAKQDRPSRSVALKVMRLGLVSRTAGDRFWQEPELLAKLSGHGAIAEVIQAGTHQTPHGEVEYYVMEFVPGAKPVTAFAADGTLDLNAKLDLFARVCSGVHHLHAHHVIHRDLKPGNILVDEQGRPKIIDFGVARDTTAESLKHTLTRKGDLVGTLQYMSPEQCRADPGQVDERSDVYALGLILYEMVTGRVPYSIGNTDLPSALSIIHNTTPVEPRRIDARLSGDVNAVVMKALAKEPALRYQTAAEFETDVRCLLRGERPQAAGDPQLLTRAKIAGRNVLIRQTVWVLLAAVVATLASLFAFVRPAMSGDNRFTRWVENWYCRLPVFAGAGRPFDRVRVIGLDESDGATLPARATELGIAGVDLALPATWRPLHAEVLRRLVRAKARVVAFDFMFGGPNSPDGGLGEAAAAAKKAKIPVIGAASTWDVLDWKKGIVTRSLADQFAFGRAYAEDEPLAFLKLWLGVNQDFTAFSPSFALLTAHRANHPDGDLKITVDAESVSVRVSGQDPEAGGRDYDAEDSVYRATTVRPIVIKSPAGEPGTKPAKRADGLKDGDRKALLWLTIPDQNLLDGATMSYTRVLNASEAEMAEWFADKVVILGNRRTVTQNGGPFRDEIKRSDGPPVWGPHYNAIAVDALLRGAPVRVLDRWQTWAMLLGISLLGAGIGRWVGGPWRVALACLALTGVGIVGSMGLLMQTGWYINPTFPVLALVISACLAAGLFRFVRSARPGVALR